MKLPYPLDLLVHFFLTVYQEKEEMLSSLERFELGACFPRPCFYFYFFYKMTLSGVADPLN
jgi:hypothetical protein